MASDGSIGYGTTFTWHAELIGELTKIGSMEMSTNKVDVTTLGAADSCKEYIPGLIELGEIPIEGWYDPDDSGQAKLWTDYKARTTQTWLITFPAGVSGATFTGTGWLSSWKAGDATPEGMVPFSAVITIATLPTVTP